MSGLAREKSEESGVDMVDAGGDAGLFEMPVGHVCPGLSRGHNRLARGKKGLFACPAMLGGFRVIAPEELRGVALDAVQGA